MRLFGFGIALGAAIMLSGCGDRAGTGGGPHHGSRYVGIGLYPAGALCQHLAGVQRPTDSRAATLADDEQIIVTVDSQTGEIRQCGNLSGHCVTMNPWSGRPAPVNLDRHAGDLTEEETTADTAQNRATNSAAEPSAPRRRPDHP